jgi:HK97 family phage major capsid protein
MEKTMLENLRQELKTLMSDIDGMDQSAEDFGVKLEQAEALKGKIEQSEANAKKLEDLKQSVTSFKPAQSQSVNSPRIEVGLPGFTQDPKVGFKNSGDFLSAVYKAGGNYNQDERLAHISQTAGTHTSVADGLMIPAEFAQGLLINESGITEDWMSRMIVEPTSSNAKTFKRSSSNTLGGSVGITAARIGENTQMSSTKEVFETATLEVSKMYAYSEVTEEDLSDISWLQGHLMMQAPKVIRKKFAAEVLSGTGTGQALGMFDTNNPNKISVTRDTASTVKAEDIAAIYARAIVSPSAFWLINRDVLAKLPLMVVGDSPIVWESYFRDGMVGMLNGLPVYQSELCSALNTAGDVRLINPEGYRILEKQGGSQFASSIHVAFDYDKTAFRWTHRISGMPWCNDVYTPTNGATLSPFVELGTA